MGYGKEDRAVVSGEVSARRAVQRPAAAEGLSMDAGALRGRALLALAALGVAVCSYLVWVRYSGSPLYCAGSGGCADVQASRYAVVAGVPIVLLGLALYTTLLGLALWRVRAGVETPVPVSLALLGLALAGTLYSTYLTYLELFVIGAICLWCIASATLLTAILGLSAWDLGALGRE